MAKWKGTVIGAGIGWLFGGPFGAILGTMAGNFFDRNSGLREGQSLFEQFNDSDRSFIFTTHLVGTLMSVAKADGHVNPHEVNIIERVFINLGFKGNELNYVRDLINKITYEDLNLEEICYQYKGVSDYNERLMLLRVVYLVAFADNLLHHGEERVINQIIEYLEIDPGDASKLRAEFIGEKTRYYEILGISNNASKEEIMQAYRILSKRYHPDKVAHLGEEFSRLAHEKFQMINKAYEEIKKERGF